MPRSYPHMCRCDHDEIGYSESHPSDERCPLCRSMDACDQLNRDKAELEARVMQLEAGIKSAISYFEDDAIDSPDCCELMATDLKNAIKT